MTNDKNVLKALKYAVETLEATYDAIKDAKGREVVIPIGQWLALDSIKKIVKEAIK